MADDEPRAGEATTANYGWTKPNVGDSDDAWGGMLNADLDGIDSTVKSVSTVANAAYPATNPSGFQTAAQVTASLVPYAPLASPVFTGTPSMPTGTTGITQTAGTSNTTLATTAFVGALPVAMGDNRIINGDFAINQRAYVSGTALATTVYGHDRWKAGPSGCTYTFTATLPDTTITITAGTLTQVIEAGAIEGGVYKLSWTGTAQARVYQGTPTGSYAASPVTTASLTAGTNTIVEFNTGTLVRVKFEIGSIATPFNRQSLAKSMADCQRYYQKLGGVTAGDIVIEGWGGAISTAVSVTIGIVTMRAAPTATPVGTWNNVNATSLGIFPSPSVVGMNVLAVAAGGNCQYFTKDTTTYITLSAEL